MRWRPNLVGVRIPAPRPDPRLGLHLSSTSHVWRLDSPRDVEIPAPARPTCRSYCPATRALIRSAGTAYTILPSPPFGPPHTTPTTWLCASTTGLPLEP